MQDPRTDDEKGNAAGDLSNKVMAVISQEPNAIIAITSLMTVLSIVISEADVTTPDAMDAFKNSLKVVRRSMRSKREH
jgi:hypothetical protein